MVGVAAAVVAMFIGSVAQAASVLVVGPGGSIREAVSGDRGGERG